LEFSVAILRFLRIKDCNSHASFMAWIFMSNHLKNKNIKEGTSYQIDLKGYGRLSKQIQRT